MASSNRVYCVSFSQLVYQLFTTSVKPGNEEVKIVMQMTEEAILAQERDPYTAFANRVRELNYGNSYFFRVSLSSDPHTIFLRCFLPL